MSENNAFTIMKYIVENDTGLIYGDTGTGKSHICLGIIREAVKLGKKVAVLDTEGNYSANVKKWLEEHTTYAYTTNFKKVLEWAEDLKPGFDLIVLDSLGAPVLGAFALASLKERGEMLLRSEAIAYLLKTYAQENDCMVLVTTQPVSEMGKQRNFKTGELLKDLEPAGGKTNFFWKEILRTEKTSTGTLKSTFELMVHRSRHMATGHKLATISLSNTGLEFSFGGYEGIKEEMPPITVITNGKPKQRRRGRPKKEEPETSGAESENEAESEKEEKNDTANDSTIENSEEVVELQKTLNTKLKKSSISPAVFQALLYGSGFKEAKTPDDLSDVDSLNEMISQLSNHIKTSEKEAGETQPAGLLDG